MISFPRPQVFKASEWQRAQKESGPSSLIIIMTRPDVSPSIGNCFSRDRMAGEKISEFKPRKSYHDYTKLTPSGSIFYLFYFISDLSRTEALFIRIQDPSLFCFSGLFEFHSPSRTFPVFNKFLVFISSS